LSPERDNTVPVDSPTAYDVLGVDPDCPQEEIQRAYAGLSRELSMALNYGVNTDHLLGFLDYHYSLVSTPANRYAYDIALTNRSDSKAIRIELSRLKKIEHRYEKLLFRCRQDKQLRKNTHINKLARMFGLQ
jgi:hypothetical protein